MTLTLILTLLTLKALAWASNVFSPWAHPCVILLLSLCYVVFTKNSLRNPPKLSSWVKLTVSWSIGYETRATACYLVNFYHATLCWCGICHGPVSVCLSGTVHLSQVGVLSKRMNESSWFWQGSFLWPLLYSVIGHSNNSQNKGTSPNYGWLDLENFATADRSCCQQNLSTVEFVDHTYESGRIVAGGTWFITRRSTVIL